MGCVCRIKGTATNAVLEMTEMPVPTRTRRFRKFCINVLPNSPTLLCFHARYRKWEECEVGLS